MMFRRFPFIDYWLSSAEVTDNNATRPALVYGKLTIKVPAPLSRKRRSCKNMDGFIMIEDTIAHQVALFTNLSDNIKC